MRIRKEIGCLWAMFHGGKNLEMAWYILSLCQDLNHFVIFVIRMFIASVKRLRIMGTSEANGLGMFLVLLNSLLDQLRI